MCIHLVQSLLCEVACGVLLITDPNGPSKPPYILLDRWAWSDQLGLDCWIEGIF